MCELLKMWKMEMSHSLSCHSQECLTFDLVSQIKGMPQSLSETSEEEYKQWLWHLPY